MPVSRFGIYLAYGATVDMRAEGLGRLFAALLMAAAKRDDIRFVIACPSWTRESLMQLCESEGIPTTAFDVLSPARKPALLRLYEHWRRRGRRRQRRARWFGLYMARAGALVQRALFPWRRRLITTRSMAPVLAVGVLVAVVAVLIMPFAMLGGALRQGGGRAWSKLQKLALRGWMAMAGTGVRRAAGDILAGRAPKDVPTVVNLYRQMEEAELDVLHRMIERAEDVTAWYCPTAFWPSVSKLDRPRLICVPDVLLSDFATSFSAIGGDRMLETFRQIERVIADGRHFVTYSAHVKNETLVRRFGVAPEAVDVVPHGAVRLEPLITIVGTPDQRAATDAFCRDVVASALRTASTPLRVGALGEATRFLFYASQFRPQKNVVNLLRACEYLLRRRFVGCKLVLTGNPELSPEIGEYLSRLRLQEEVLFLQRLSSQQLAACYRQAALAINPSLFEGGLPFTFSEAVSVGTPAVMARIPVTLDAIRDPELREWMLFDPYDWKDMAARIEWALANRDRLLQRQRAYFDTTIAPRSWDHVLDEHLEILRRIATGRTAAPA